MARGGVSVESSIARRFVPFAAVGLLALLTTALPPQPTQWAYVWIAVGHVRDRGRGRPVAVVATPDESDLELVARADEALYEAKRSGRNALVSIS